jgi:hypothetical protein
MPEAAVNHHHDPGTAEQDVCPPAADSQQRNIHPVSQAPAVKLLAKRHLRRGVADLLALEPCADRRRQRHRGSGPCHYLIMPSTAVNSDSDRTPRCRLFGSQGLGHRHGDGVSQRRRHSVTDLTQSHVSRPNPRPVVGKALQ